MIGARNQQMHLRPELTRVTTGAFSAVGGTWGEASVAFTADLLLAVVFGSKGLQRRFDDTATETEDEMECGFLEDQPHVRSRPLRTQYMTATSL